ncbi:MFS_1 domain-containing protein [Rhizoctonia solani AG-1 IA]|uniref:MFS_1 domain-containing protein n=1 Tax=Thanatephorus cucumeris (strain AG1-IA) TaxID=983506 RepID=L8WHD0_THACA|nr:MFS_1 domain-containing protein [Rhizoctonia solani AG-1 IA]
MTQTATCEIELLDALPHLESGSRFDRAKTLPVQTPHATANNPDAEYFSGINALEGHGHPTGSGYSLPTPPSTAQISGIRIGNIFIEDKVLYLAGVSPFKCISLYRGSELRLGYQSCMGIFVVGLNETATGANLPSFQDYYHLPYDTVSLVFLGGFIGYLISCMLNSVLQNAIGTRNVLLLAGALYAGGSLLISFAPPFPAVMVGLCFMGFGAGFYEAALTSVVSHFEDNRYMNILYLVSPFIIGALAKIGAAWKLYYWFPFVLASLITGSHFIIFRNYSTPSDREEVSEHEGVRAKFKRVVHMPIACVRTALTPTSQCTNPELVVDFVSYGNQRIWPGCFSISVVHALGCPNTPGILSIISARAPPSLKGIVISSMIEKVTPGLRILPPVIVSSLALSSMVALTVAHYQIVLASLSALVFWTVPPRRKVD